MGISDYLLTSRADNRSDLGWSGLVHIHAAHVLQQPIHIHIYIFIYIIYLLPKKRKERKHTPFKMHSKMDNN